MNSGPGRHGPCSSRAALFCATAFCLAPGMLAVGAPAYGATVNEERKAPMQFTWVACEPNCWGWIGAVGIVTGDTPKNFDEFAHGRDLEGTTVVLDSNGGSVNDAIALGRRWREIGLRTTVGATVTSKGGRFTVTPRAWCESMCVFLLLSGKVRYVPEEASVGVHQIWMSNRTENAKASTYTAQDMMVVERDIGRLAKYTFDMGGTGDLLLLSLNVPPWEDLHELSSHELQMTNLANTDAVADVLRDSHASEPAVASLSPKSVDRLVSISDEEKIPPALRSTKTADAALPAGGFESEDPVPK